MGCCIAAAIAFVCGPLRSSALKVRSRSSLCCLFSSVEWVSISIAKGVFSSWLLLLLLYSLRRMAILLSDGVVSVIVSSRVISGGLIAFVGCGFCLCFWCVVVSGWWCAMLNAMCSAHLSPVSWSFVIGSTVMIGSFGWSLLVIDAMMRRAW